MSKLLILNGPNLNLLGTREPTQYGFETLADVEEKCRVLAAKYDVGTEAFQNNIEGELINAIHRAGEEFKRGECKGIVFNPGAYTHTSIALHDAIKGVDVPVVEVHISNVHARESFRHHSYISPVAAGTIIGMGTRGYELAIEFLLG
ncbi:type II 3-dehydroquinate dehydratase [Vibrio sp. SS-MA-C1-2]|uniref:type II 3-dehydroquinate dehydratase n=1 Tax=Vibrio sp. SS-MA-C1-2 TaxID=2908646 RepID=UPI001F281116|nr:type II 3-dehydroquinate dehydratase [Vibrio sp. SS-MA-C1-2]UJF17852.1 type II 3-dehydroquinate dehydratase [Vibrio sp. SS-MA-C1-2]